MNTKHTNIRYLELRLTIVILSTLNLALSTSFANEFDEVSSAGPKRLGGGQVWSIAFSPDGKTLAAAHAADSAVLLWDPRTEEQVGAMKTTSLIEFMAFSPDGTLLALGGQDNTIRLWDVAGRNQVGVMQSPTPWGVTSVAFSPDGTTLASAGGWNDNAVYLWDVQTQQQVGTLTGLTQESVLAVAFSPDGRLLASGGDRRDGAVRLWDIQTQQQVAELMGHIDFTYGLAFSPDGTILASAGGWDDKAVFLWDIQEQTRLGALRGHSAHVGSVAFSPNGKLLASTAYWDDTVYLWDVPTQTQVASLAGHDASDIGWGDQVAFSSDGTWLACGSENGVEFWELNLPSGAGPIAFGPAPSNEAEDVFYRPVLQWRPGPYAEQHDVYFGTDYGDVNDAGNTDPGAPDLVYRGRQDGNSYAVPESLNFDQTYYWRIDEVNGPPDDTVFQGNVWSFTTEPFSIPVTNVSATASGSFGVSVPENTVNGSGLVDDLHGVSAADMWISAGIPATIEYAFDRAYKLHQLWIWNSNQLVESFVGFGAKDVVIEHSLDGENWNVLEGVAPLAQALGQESYAHNSTIDFGGVTAQYVRMTINSVQGIAPQASLSEVRFFTIPTYPTQPQPADGEVTDSVDVTLHWRSGRAAVSHEVLLSSDPAAVQDGSAVIAIVNDNSFTPDDLIYGTQYNWRIDEVNEAESPSTFVGDLWTFATPEFAVVDDMESYRDKDFFEIWATWKDGFDDPANGSVVGNGDTGAPETGMVHSGNQSLPIRFDNSTAAVSEATRTFDPPLDWVRGDPEVLSLFFLGDPTVVRNKLQNNPAPLYVVVTDSSGQTVQVDYPDPAATHITSWTEWIIPLSNLATLNISGIESMTIGIGGDGSTGTGKMFFDNIRIGTPRPPAP